MPSVPGNVEIEWPRSSLVDDREIGRNDKCAGRPRSPPGCRGIGDVIDPDRDLVAENGLQAFRGDEAVLEGCRVVK